MDFVEYWYEIDNGINPSLLKLYQLIEASTTNVDIFTHKLLIYVSKLWIMPAPLVFRSFKYFRVTVIYSSIVAICQTISWNSCIRWRIRRRIASACWSEEETHVYTELINTCVRGYLMEIVDILIRRFF